MSRYLVCLVLAACTNNGPMTSSGDDDDAPGPDAGPQADVSPRTGGWHYTESTPVHNTCNHAVQGEDGAFAIDQVLAGGFHVVPNDGTTPFTCSLSHGSFDCPDRAWHTEDLRPSVDAVLTAHGTATGTFSSTVRATGQQKLTVTCQGSACSSFGSSCTFDVDFVIEAL